MMDEAARLTVQRRWAGAIAGMLVGAMGMMGLPALAEANVIQNGDFSQGLQDWPATTVAAGTSSAYPPGSRRARPRNAIPDKPK